LPEFVISVHDQHNRSSRPFPGERVATATRCERLLARDCERPFFTGLYRAVVELRSRVHRAPRGMPEPEPNAPLLIRIVRDPYVETPGWARRIKLFEPVQVGGRELVSRGHPVAESRAERGDPVAGNPLKTLALHPEPLSPPPPVDAWLATRGAAWSA